MPDFIKCTECGDLFNPAFLDQIVKHMHNGMELNETIKGRIVEKQDCAGCHFEHVKGTICKCRTCGKVKDIKF